MHKKAWKLQLKFFNEGKPFLVAHIKTKLR